MLDYYSYPLCIYIFSFLAIMADSISFTLKKGFKGKDDYLKLKEQFCDLAMLFFIITVSVLYFTKSTFFLSSTVSIYIILVSFILSECIKGNYKPKKLRLVNKRVFIHIFTLIYILITINTFKRENYYYFNNKYYIHFVSSVFCMGLYFIMDKCINNSPDFAVKEVKEHLRNYISLTFFSVIYILYILTGILVGYNIICIIYLLIYLMVLIFANVVYLKYIKSINQPYGFKIEDGIIKSDKAIEISLDGTKIFLNIKSKNARLLFAGILIYILTYIYLIYLLTI